MVARPEPSTFIVAVPMGCPVGVVGAPCVVVVVVVVVVGVAELCDADVPAPELLVDSALGVPSVPAHPAAATATAVTTTALTTTAAASPDTLRFVIVAA
jgi:hypothetical protein